MFQGIPLQGYTELIRQLLAGIEVRTGVDFLQDRKTWEAMADKVVFTGRIDQYFGKCGETGYRSLRLRKSSWIRKTIRDSGDELYGSVSSLYPDERKHFTKGEFHYGNQ